MNNLKNKKRLTTAVVAFMMVFVVGAAFAFTDGGMLDITGTINLNPDFYVVWADTTIIDPDGVLSEESIAVVNERGRTSQRIEIEVEFEGSGTISIPLTAVNESPTTDAEIVSVSAIATTVNAAWLAEFGAAAAAGITNSITFGGDFADMNGDIIPADTDGNTYELTITFDASDLDDRFVVADHNAALTFVIEFEYEPV